jgi:hypothetical protein
VWCAIIMAPPLRVLPSVRVNKGVERRVEKWPWAPVASRLAAAPVCVCVYGCSRAGHRRVGREAGTVQRWAAHHGAGWWRLSSLRLRSRDGEF